MALSGGCFKNSPKSCQNSILKVRVQISFHFAMGNFNLNAPMAYFFECPLRTASLLSWLMCEDIFLSARPSSFCCVCYANMWESLSECFIFHIFSQKLWALWAKAKSVGCKRAAKKANGLRRSVSWFRNFFVVTNTERNDPYKTFLCNNSITRDSKAPMKDDGVNKP